MPHARLVEIIKYLTDIAAFIPLSVAPSATDNKENEIADNSVIQKEKR
jgi:hypothetical protein